MAALDALGRPRGEVIGPEDAVRPAPQTFNAIGRRRPAAIARCASRDDVVAALAIAAERGLPVAVRGGGTSDAATVDGGVVIDLALMDGDRDRPGGAHRARRRRRHLGDLDEATQEHGLAVTGARLSRLGVAGVALGDGSGWLERALGPTAASLVGAEVVLADGRVVEAARGELLWALRGAAALGVVTRLDLRLHPVGPSCSPASSRFPRERAAEVATRLPGLHGAGARRGRRRAAARRRPGRRVHDRLLPRSVRVEDGRGGRRAAARARAHAGRGRAQPVRRAPAHLGRQQPARARAPTSAARVLRELPDDCIDAAVARADLPAASLSLRVPAAARRRARRIRTPGGPTTASGCGRRSPASTPGRSRWVDGFADAVSRTAPS